MTFLKAWASLIVFCILICAAIASVLGIAGLVLYFCGEFSAAVVVFLLLTALIAAMLPRTA